MIRINERRCKERFYEGEHLKIWDLQRYRIPNNYIYNSVPAYPEGVEFHISRLRHDTNLRGYHGICNSSGFKKPTESDSPERDLVWWSPDISRRDITAAEEQYLDKEEIEYPEKQFLHKFTSSPAFLSSSRLGNFRFSMPIHDLFESYKEQFCADLRPHIRIFETVVYKQEVMYSIVIHSPSARDLFSKYPLLKDTPNAVCVFRHGNIIWRPQAMSKRHSFRLSCNMQAIRIATAYREDYVWDNIGVAFHVPHGKTLSFTKKTLTKSLRLCKGAEPKSHNEEFVTCEFDLIRP
ncbi:uncharacterized protein si:ch211-197h24.8 [Danio rerio]|uniref:Si:ch211-197h24.8 n=1 Tax=Danio rerio TaxID=7955 RepID=A0A0R4IB64_DANRE|nr:uncharacterized protein si:ch211-197h24.8 [Danio rerio]|eukprot:XP_003200245.1 uncharacterized protein si:ch211-197h24.8 [Danio rerio]